MSYISSHPHIGFINNEVESGDGGFNSFGVEDTLAFSLVIKSLLINIFLR